MPPLRARCATPAMVMWLSQQFLEHKRLKHPAPSNEDEDAQEDYQ